MDKDALSLQLLALFVEELDEHLRTLNADLLALEEAGGDAGARAERLAALFRTVHVIKGSSRSASVRAIEVACHQLETRLGRARESGGELSRELFALFFATADALGDAQKRLRAGQSLAGGPLDQILAQLEAGAGGARTIDAAAAAAASVAPEAARAAAGSLRVAAEKLDALVARAAEVLIAQRRVESRDEELAALQDTVLALVDATRRRDGESGKRETLAPLAERVARDVDRLAAAMRADWRALARATRPLDDDVRRARMVPFVEACRGLERAVRDLAVASHKEARVIIEGGDVELDRALIENLRDPLLQLVRNAIDHGIEPPAARQAAGKPAAGTVTVRAEVSGTSVRVIVRDDGGGLDRESIAAQARKKGLPEPAGERELQRLLFQPGFSTARIITDISGRGVGLDVVRTQVEALHGTIEVASDAGRGVTFTLVLPLTLTTLRALVVVAGGQTFAVALSAVERIVRFSADEVRSIETREMLTLDGWPVPVLPLAAALGLPPSEARPGGMAAAVVLAAERERVAFLVDELVNEQDVVLKRFGARLKRVRFLSGATLLPSGVVALILNAPELVAGSVQRPVAASLEAQLRAAPGEKRRRIVLADDSVTTRALEKSILEGAGYEVLAAVDGAEAWRLLQDHGADLVVTDVEMPRMDGFALTEAIRRSPRFRDLPVVLVTALEREPDRARGLDAGANAYLVKSSFDQRNLLAAIAQLIT